MPRFAHDGHGSKRLIIQSFAPTMTLSAGEEPEPAQRHGMSHSVQRLLRGCERFSCAFPGFRRISLASSIFSLRDSHILPGGVVDSYFVMVIRFFCFMQLYLNFAGFLCKGEAPPHSNQFRPMPVAADPACR